mmetsp:Transcript_7644/g.18083  ORF Transcript_7644/g.18083 Transcript_7644/m.18083 type:complete len:303 (-) Transcript_7644:413-1321(-)
MLDDLHSAVQECYTIHAGECRYGAPQQQDVAVHFSSSACCLTGRPHICDLAGSDVVFVSQHLPGMRLMDLAHESCSHEQCGPNSDSLQTMLLRISAHFLTAFNSVNQLLPAFLHQPLACSVRSLPGLLPRGCLCFNHVESGSRRGRGDLAVELAKVLSRSHFQLLLPPGSSQRDQVLCKVLACLVTSLRLIHDHLETKILLPGEPLARNLLVGEGDLDGCDGVGHRVVNVAAESLNAHVQCLCGGHGSVAVDLIHHVTRYICDLHVRVVISHHSHFLHPVLVPSEGIIPAVRALLRGRPVHL